MDGKIRRVCAGSSETGSHFISLIGPLKLGAAGEVQLNNIDAMFDLPDAKRRTSCLLREIRLLDSLRMGTVTYAEACGTE